MTLQLSLRQGETRAAQDPRFGLAWLSSAAPGQTAPLVVAVHGSHRDHLATRDAFLPLAESRPLHVLAPLFPEGLTEAGYGDGYKFLSEPGIDYVALLDGMIAGFAAEHGPVQGKPLLFGFSGGAQFAHRYALFRAARLSGLVIAAPGAVTLPRADLPWWPGLAGAAAATGYTPDLPSLRAIPVLVTIGAEDRSPGILRDDPALRHGSAHAGAAGADRIARAQALRRALADQGVAVALIQIPGAGHALLPNVQAALPVMAGWLADLYPTERARRI